MKKILDNPLLLLASRFVLGMVFIVAAVDKISQPEGFASAIQAYDMTPIAIINILAIVLPWLELICGVFLVGGVYVRSGALLLSVMLVVFIVAISTAILRGLDINCGCYGGSGESQVGWRKVIEDVALLVPAWLLIRQGGSRSGAVGRARTADDAPGRGQDGT